MAIYKYNFYLTSNSNNTFDMTYVPGAMTPVSGVYRCHVCGREIVSEENRPLPPQNHHQHAYNLGPIRWQLIVYADHQAK